MLGAPYEQQVLDLGHDDEGPVVATLVHRRADTRTSRAVLYVHGFADYFFQDHLAGWYIDHGWDFYAVDLRKYGRSLLPHQTPNFCRSLTEYFPDLDAAMEVIHADHTTLLLNGHSTGGLIAALWAHARRADGVPHGLFLNSPFFDLNVGRFMRGPGAGVVSGLARARPYRVVAAGLSTVYGRSLHAEHNGEWSYDVAWKPAGGFPVRAGWLRAIRRGQLRLQAGLDIPAPVLVAMSGASHRSWRWSPRAMNTDTVLNVADMARWAPGLGRHVTIVRIDGGLHDLVLSAAPVREQVFSELGRWLEAYVPSGETRPRRPGNAPEDGG